MFERNGKHYLVSRPPTRIGAAIDNFNKYSVDPMMIGYVVTLPPSGEGTYFDRLNNAKATRIESLPINLFGDRGIDCFTSGEEFSFTEFKKYYIKGETFDTLIINGWEDMDDNIELIFASAFANEIMFCLMTEHGVSYEAAVKLIPGLIVPDGYYDFLNVEKTGINIHREIGDLLEGEVEFLIKDKILKLLTRARDISNDNGFDYEQYFTLHKIQRMKRKKEEEMKRKPRKRKTKRTTPPNYDFY